MAFRKNDTYIRHGMSGTPTYKSWQAARDRCRNPENQVYGRYGGRGITMCDSWCASFENFLDDMGPAPEGLTIERIDNDGDYEPSNCQWATMKVQGRNRRNSRQLTHEGRTQCLSAWAEETGLTHYSIAERLRLRWPMAEALGFEDHKPRGNRVRRNNRNLTHAGRTQCVAAWAEESGLTQGCILARLRAGWPTGRALARPARGGK